MGIECEAAEGVKVKETMRATCCWNKCTLDFN